MNLFNNHNLDFMDSGFVFEGNSSPKTNIRTVTSTSNNNSSQQQNLQRNLIKTNYNNPRNRTLSSTYHFVSSPADRPSLYSIINNNNDTNSFDDEDQYLNLESYRRSRNEDQCSSLPSNSINFEDKEDKSNELDKVKTKLASIWNNVKYGWTAYSKKVRTNFDKTTPICILGRFYSNDDNHLYYSTDTIKPLNSLQASINTDYCYVADDDRHQIFKSFEDDISTRLWFTYRKDFSPINGTKYTSDAGWGCMLRSVQMLIAQGFLIHFLGRSWSLLDEHLPRSEKLHREILSWFNDRLSNKCPFGLHRLLNIANDKIGKRVGDWFGPGSVILLVRDALENAREYIPLLNNINIYVAQDCTIYKQDILDMCCLKRENESSSTALFKPVIILVSVRLGGEELNEIYIPTLKLFLEMENCLGIIGDDKVIYLDPHIAQEHVDMSKYHTNLDLDISSFHCHIPGKTSFSKLDPSLAIGFYCKSRDEFETFCNFINNITVDNKKRKPNDLIHPIFSICDDNYEKTSLKFGLLMNEDDSLVSINPSMLSSNDTTSKQNRLVAGGVQSSPKTPKKFNYKNLTKKFLSNNQKEKQSTTSGKDNETEDFVLI